MTYTPEERKQALERLKFNVAFDMDTLVCRALGIFPPINQELLQQAMRNLSELQSECNLTIGGEDGKKAEEK